MAAYLVTFITAHNLEWVADYLANVPKIIHQFGGEYLALSRYAPNAVEIVEGSASAPDSIVIFKFASMAAIKSFVQSPEYAPYKKARSAGTESNFFAFENDEEAPQLRGSNHNSLL